MIFFPNFSKEREMDQKKDITQDTEMSSGVSKKSFSSVSKARSLPGPSVPSFKPYTQLFTGKGANRYYFFFSIV